MEPNHTPPQSDFETKLATRKAALPKVIRDAIDSADIAARLRGMAEKHRLHVDVWELLENEVRLTLLGFEDAANLAKNIEKELGVPAADAESLALDINESVFEPIREELERGLGSPQAKEVEVTELETLRTQAIAAERASGSTPPPPLLTAKATRAPLSSAYVASQPSHERKAVDGDPYREPPV